MTPLLRVPVLLALALTALVGCGGTTPSTACTKDADCASPQLCRDSVCSEPAAVTPECTAGQTRPCGNEAVGACRKGTQRCVDGKFETACTGEVKPITETCNLVDDDCDGQVDEGVDYTWYLDADGDGAGAGAPVSACTRPQGHSDNALDCDDRAGAGAGIHPGATEVCDALRVDENCDGTVNEGCGCSNPGSTQPCCGGRGQQTCEAAGTLSACSATVGAELCNGVDDDCDGQVDEQAVLSNPDGGANDGTCAVGVGACARPGTAACTNGAVVCNGTPGTPELELCNGLDDDCDGQVDDQALVALTDGGTLPLAAGGGVANGDGSCTVGVGACVRSGATSCVGAGLVCSEGPGAPATEVCNALDDDCDGAVDEAGPGLCAVTGQTCAGGACACPSGQSACNGACVTLTTEVCDGVDNDCDGQVDEGLLQACYDDADGDLYANNTTVVLRCPASSRPAAGFCPAGYVAPANSPAVDCNGSSGSLYRLVSSRNDQDNDGLCTGAAANDCVGATALPGRRFAASCSASTDCDDTSGLLYRLVNSRADADGDGYCVGGVTADCVGATALPGRRFDAACLAPDDCLDSNGGVFRTASVRVDSDGDQYCVGAGQMMCIGSSPPAGYRLTSGCQGDDCRDSNSQATTTCTLTNAYATAYRSSTCPSGPVTSTLTVVNFCPIGFTLGGYRANVSAGGGSCAAASPTSITQTCNFLEGTTCRVVGDCVAQ